MSARSFVRLSLFSLCGLAMVLSGLAEALVAQQVPPPLPPPEVSRPGGGNNDENASGRRGGPPPSVGARNRRGGIRGASSNMDQAKPKFEELLEDEDLSRFRGYKDERIGDGWEIDGKYLHFDGSSGSGDIITVDEFDNFELQFDFKVTEGGNSGVMYRVSLGDDQPYISGPEYQVLDDEGHPDGKSELTSAGSIYGLYAPENKKSRKAGTWNQARIIVNGNSVVHYLNGAKVVEAEIGSADWNERLDKSKFKDWEKYAKNSKGHIAFQDHGNEVWYRKIRIKRLTQETASNNRSSQSDSRGGADRGRPAAATGRPSTRRRPNFSNQGSGLEKDDDKDKRGGDRGNSRADSRDSSRMRPPAGVPSTRRRPNFSNQGSGLQKDDEKDKEKDDKDRGDNRTDSRDRSRPPASTPPPSTRKRPNFSNQGSGLATDKKKEKEDEDDDKKDKKDN